MPMTSPHIGNFVQAEPVAIGSALTAILNALVLLGVLDLSADQIGGINVAVAAVLGLLIRSRVTPVARADERGAADVVLMLAVATFVGVVLLLFGIRLG